MANVITYGTVDLFHVGQLQQLQRARSVVRKELLYLGGRSRSVHFWPLGRVVIIVA